MLEYAASYILNEGNGEGFNLVRFKVKGLKQAFLEVSLRSAVNNGLLSLSAHCENLFSQEPQG